MPFLTRKLEFQEWRVIYGFPNSIEEIYNLTGIVFFETSDEEVATVALRFKFLKDFLVFRYHTNRFSLEKKD